MSEFKKPIGLHLNLEGRLVAANGRSVTAICVGKIMRIRYSDESELPGIRQNSEIIRNMPKDANSYMIIGDVFLEGRSRSSGLAKFAISVQYYRR